MSLASYLAKNYLTADSEKKPKKRKRSHKNGGLTIDDDENLGWKTNVDEDDDDAPTIVGGGTLPKSKKKSKSAPTASWTTIGVAAPSHAQQLAADEAASSADAIISRAAQDRQRAADAEDEAPSMHDPDGVLRMQSGAKAGLQSAAEVAAAMKQKQNEEKRKAAEAAAELGAAAQETIYRDASGRIINVAMQRAEARKKAEDEARKAAEALRAARGDVQNTEAAKRKAQLFDAKTLTVARHADDLDLNAELKAKGHWNDPAANFLRKKKAGRSVTGKPLYQGAFQPNRYGIRPGHRWDGVDRGNGFEALWFKARNQRGERERAEYAWQMDE